MAGTAGNQRHGKNRYSCTNCSEACATESVKCSLCRQWTHRTCVSEDVACMQQIDENALKFFCRSCATTAGEFDYRRSLLRCQGSIRGNRLSLLSAVASERCVMNIYGAQLPSEVRYVDDAQVDMVSLQILKMSQSNFLNELQPMVVYGDGNCLFRAVSLALFGSQKHHHCLRLLTFMELVEHREWYDVRSPHYRRTLNLSRRDTSSYTRLLDAAASTGACCEMMHLLALSAVIQTPIQSLCPTSPNCTPHPYSFRVVGRDVPENRNVDPQVVIMWTSVIMPNSMNDFTPNHFVCLLPSYRTVNEANVSSLNLSSSMHTVIENNDEAGQPETEMHDIEQNRYDGNANGGETVNVGSDTGMLEEYGGCEQRSTDSDENVTYFPCDNAASDDDEDVVDSLRPVVREERCGLEDDDGRNNCRYGDRSSGSCDDVEPSDEDVGSGYTSSEACCETSCVSKGKRQKPSTDFFQPLPNGKRLETNSVIQLLQKAHGTLPVNIPPGQKNNVYVLIDNSRNVTRKADGKRLTFADDRGAWSTPTSSMPRTTYVADEHGSWRRVFLKGNRYCIERNHARNVYTYIELTPQPASSDVVVLRHYYTRLTTAPEVYSRRVSWLEGGSSALVEYTGIFPGHEPHGNATVNRTNYRRTPPEILEAIGRQTGLHTAKQVFKQVADESPAGNGPRNLSQVHCKMSAVRRQHSKKTLVNTTNTADGIINVLNMLHTDDFVQSVIGDKDVTPSIILYFPSQMFQMSQFCFNIKAGCVLTFDTTFNLTKGMYVTTSVYKHLSLLSVRSGEEPIFLGPVFIHSSLTAKSYGTFFHHIATALGDCDFSALTVGSDDDAALRKAMSREFPGASQVVCSRHLKQNVERHLRDEINLGGDSGKRRRDILTTLFGTAGLSSVTDVTQFDHHVDYALKSIGRKLQSTNEGNSSAVLTYLRDRVIPHLRQNAAAGRPGWTSNNVESIHHVLKSFNNWRMHKLPDLIQTIKGVVSVQQHQFEQSMYGEGDYVLRTDIARKFQCSYDHWVSMTDKQRQHQMRSVSRLPGITKIATSTDGHLNVTASPAAGKKTNQRKRFRNVRTMSFHKSRRLN